MIKQDWKKFEKLYKNIKITLADLKYEKKGRKEKIKLEDSSTRK